ncbi:uncharacterized protein EURHEDRAFT_408943 [Aspergillus ruber CBS 135680]|uniref:Uncharacterized protein n=1 Tax=Aspergillus ruber (strain CBS 135680) TaxID=1388766 RepID=A0A017SPR7_ASPRC|nr:uncharacterized protein EURHEDRAFT_408943 [Aspergillus ruber CBS 135680]EYE98589.1 hypothetical protein EURHEDRAFT_408943 [Aspergillus ruber CBS 135680]
MTLVPSGNITEFFMVMMTSRNAVQEAKQTCPYVCGELCLTRASFVSLGLIASRCGSSSDKLTVETE